MKKVIRFTASWCQPCKSLSKTLDKINLNLPIDVVDIDEQSDVAIEYGIRSVPTMLIVEDGSVLKRLIGLRTEEEIRKWLND
jgi:thioredoxin-like negative regulator of GroEL